MMKLGEILNNQTKEKLEELKRLKKKEVIVNIKKIGEMALIHLSKKLRRPEAANLVLELRNKMKFKSWRFVQTKLEGKDVKKYVYKLGTHELIEVE